MRQVRRSRWLAVTWVLSLLLGAFSGVDGQHNDGDIDDILPLGETMMVEDGTSRPYRGLSPLGNNTGERRLMVQAPQMVSQLTGADSPARTDARWNITGTDLGLSFEHNGKTYLVFGDTWGRGGGEGPDWRSNTMAIIEPDPNHGYILTDVISDENGEAKELLSSLKSSKREYTVIPTAGVAVGERMYLHYLSVNDWKKKWWGYKEPVPNGSGLAYSDDQGQTWIKDEKATWTGNSPFTQAAMVAHGDYVYMFGTPTGRFGAAKLMRVPSNVLLEPEHYEYWSDGAWSPELDHATNVVPAPVGELSVRWNPYHQRWLMMYKNEVTHDIVVRTAKQLTGPWDDERVVVTSDEYPTLYAPFMLPITGPDVYFTMSLFSPKYQVFLMRMTLSVERSNDTTTYAP